MIKDYDRHKAIAYAQKWALKKNPAFYYFGGIGGDCTNFISQCLLAGGGVMNYDKYNGWFYNSASSRSPSWTGVRELQNFLLREKGVGPFAYPVSKNALEIGDIIQLRQNPNHFNHSLIITKIEGKQIYVCAHSNDALNLPLSSYSFIEMLCLHIEGIRT